MVAAQGQRMPRRVHPHHRDRWVRYAVRHNAIAAIPDADECKDKTLVFLHGCGCPGVATLGSNGTSQAAPLSLSSRWRRTSPIR